MKTGLIGYGAWGRHHADAIAETEGLELAAICARSEASRAAAREKFPGILVTESWPELLDAVDAVDIVLPTDLHRAAAGAALEAGRHVLLEKPMALNPAECEELIALAEASGKVLYVAHEFRLSTQWGRMRALVEEGAIGAPRYATIDLWRRPYRLGSANWRYDAPRVGSWVLEEPIHFFDLACWWLREAGRPVSVYARGSRHSGTPEGLWNDMTTVLAFENGAHATITQTLAICEHHLTAKVVGETGAVLATWDGEMDRTLRPQAGVKLFRGQALEEIPIAPSGESFELRAELARFAAACDGREALPITPREAALAVAICWAAEKSIELCTPVSL